MLRVDEKRALEDDAFVPDAIRGGSAGKAAEERRAAEDRISRSVAAAVMKMEVPPRPNDFGVRRGERSHPYSFRFILIHLLPYASSIVICNLPVLIFRCLKTLSGSPTGRQ